MKSRYVRPYSKREMKAIGEIAERQTHRSLAKVQWVMIVALNDALGLGEERILRVLDRYPELLEEYGDLRRTTLPMKCCLDGSNRFCRKTLPSCTRSRRNSHGKTVCRASGI